MATSPFLSLRDTADALKISMPTLHRRLNDGSIPSVKVGRRRLIPATYLDTLVESAATMAKPGAAV